MKKLFLLFHTVKYLKFKQLYFRLVRKLTHPKVNQLSLPLSSKDGNWCSHTLYEPKLVSPLRVKLLNVEADISETEVWNSDKFTKLWLYNLHYFDYLHSANADSMHAENQTLIKRWIDENMPPAGNGWEPYPISLRIVNWIKAHLGGQPLDQRALDSLATQADFLSQDLEYHLLGNHLFVNAKALVFAGCFFDGKQAQKWLESGTRILYCELEEQILDDGANFELTPMYHGIMLVDLLDLYNLAQCFAYKFDKRLIALIQQKIPKMLDWLEAMSHLDGDISFFNDSATGIAPTNQRIFDYAETLGFSVGQSKRPSLLDFSASGYVVARTDSAKLIADLGNIGPDYIPGHAHADTLSFELSVFGCRFIVNSGISEYGLSQERLRQRQTAAHNSVSLKELSSSEVWSGFRVARRATISNRSVKNTDTLPYQFNAQHDGFVRQKRNCVHHRSWSMDTGKCVITDSIIGDRHDALGHLHFHPELKIELDRDFSIKVDGERFRGLIKIYGGKPALKESAWHPQFGLSIENKKLEYTFEQGQVKIEISWEEQ